MPRVLGPEEGGGPPSVLPWTLVVEDEDWSADLEHGATLPRVGERIDFIGDNGTQRAFEVTAVVHTVQHTSSDRPPVSAEREGPNSTNADASNARPTILRAGLPRVIARAVEGDDPG